MPPSTDTVTLTVDEEGLSDTCTATVTVEDDTGPSITCPNMKVECTEPAGAVVTFEPTVSDNCDLDPTVTCADWT